jgi:HK97 gp10 family phage protein
MTASLKFSGGPQLEAASRIWAARLPGAWAPIPYVLARALSLPRRAAECLCARVSSRAASALPKIGRSAFLVDGNATAYAGTKLFYANFVEFGTAHASANPFLRPVADEAAQEAVDKLAENLGAGIVRETAKYRGR